MISGVIIGSGQGATDMHLADGSRLFITSFVRLRADWSRYMSEIKLLFISFYFFCFRRQFMAKNYYLVLLFLLLFGAVRNLFFHNSKQLIILTRNYPKYPLQLLTTATKHLNFTIFTLSFT